MAKVSKVEMAQGRKNCSDKQPLSQQSLSTWNALPIPQPVGINAKTVELWMLPVKPRRGFFCLRRPAAMGNFGWRLEPVAAGGSRQGRKRRRVFGVAGFSSFFRRAKLTGMFFPLSKILWDLVAPSHILLWTSAGAAILLMAGRPVAGRALAVASAILFLLIGVLPTGTWLLRPLEFQYRRPASMPASVDGIITLGGGSSMLARLVGTYELSQRYPGAKVLFSGGPGSLNDKGPTDAKRARRILAAMGLDPSRVLYEDKSRNTWENILFSQRMTHPEPGQVWILATSAIQIPRAMAVAQKLQWRMTPWPTDCMAAPYTAGWGGISPDFSIPDNLQDVDTATHEWLGILVYRAMGMAAAVPGSG